MHIGEGIVKASIDRHWVVTIVVVAAAVAVGLLAGLPSVWPGGLPGLHSIAVDTDPENMLPADQPDRRFHGEMKKTLALHDIVVVGVVNDEHPDGVFNPQSLRKIYELTEFAKGLRGGKIGAAEGEGVVAADLIAPSTVDYIAPAGGAVKFDWLMREPPTTAEEARAVRERAMRIPFLRGTLVSDKPGKEGKAVALYLPLTRKDLSYRVSRELQKEIARLGGPEQFYITGLPVAEDTFGVEMFVQMAISAPAAMVVIFVLMLVFFRKVLVVLAPMIVALMSVVFTMGGLIVAGFPIHIMSSMIPIFIMPIAVLDSIHIISEFFERYQATRDRRATMLKVMDELFAPMLYTSLTSAAGFASLALTPIPPVQVFGLFVAAGIMIAWALTVTFIPAFVMFISPHRLAGFGARHVDGQAEEATAMSRAMRWMGGASYRWAKPILAAALVVLAIAGWGISRIVINDNPVKWFTKSHPIRVADRVLNEHFGGTYMAYLAVEAEQEKWEAPAAIAAFKRDLDSQAADLKQAYPSDAAAMIERLKALADAQAGAQAGAGSRVEFFERMAAGAAEEAGKATGDAAYAWDDAGLLVDRMRQASEVFKDPAVLAHLERLAAALAEAVGDDGQRIVGKSNSLADIVKTVYRDLVSGKDEDYKLPATREGVAQCLMQYQSSHRYNDLWHFVTPDYRTSSMWVQLTSGDNRDMQKVVEAAERFVAAAEQAPAGGASAAKLRHRWFGLTYINVVWQEKMVVGMLSAFTGSFLVVLLLMTILFRSALWGLLSMIPLTVTIAAIYGVIGLVGKDYDMPVAVLSSLTLGMAVDFAIHFLARGRSMQAELGSWRKAAPAVFGEPARAITRNIIVIAAGFLPLLLAPLVPYKTVGIFLAAILVISGIGTLVLLPALVRVLERWLFRPGPAMGGACNCVLCGFVTVLVVAVVAMNLHEWTPWGWATITWVAGAAIVAAGIGCGILSRRAKCRQVSNMEKGQ